MAAFYADESFPLPVVEALRCQDPDRPAVGHVHVVVDLNGRFE